MPSGKFVLDAMRFTIDNPLFVAAAVAMYLLGLVWFPFLIIALVLSVLAIPVGFVISSKREKAAQALAAREADRKQPPLLKR